MGNGRATPSSGREASSGVVVLDAEEGTKKRRKQCLQEVLAVANDDGGNDEEAGGFGVARVTITVGGGKRQARPPTNHFERLLEQACPNHAYSVKHKVRDYNMMKNFMVSASIT
jgi:hypothetical protein